VNRPKNYTTKIAARVTAGECLSLLAEAGADHVALSYTDKQPSGLTFRLDTPIGPRDFRLPVNVKGMRSRLEGAEAAGDFDSTRQRIGSYSTREHAERVAWRVCRDWLDAVLALVAAEMADISEAFAAYRVLDGGMTVAERLALSDHLPAIEGDSS